MIKLTEEQQKFLEENQNLAYKIANHLQKKHKFLALTAKEDLVQYCLCAMCQIIPKYSPEKSRFSTFAYMAVERLVLRKLCKEGHLISMPMTTIQSKHHFDRIMKDWSKIKFTPLSKKAEKSLYYQQENYLQEMLEELQKALEVVRSWKPLWHRVLSQRLSGKNQTQIAEELGFHREYIGDMERSAKKLLRAELQRSL